jgi:radical SAM protein with 4Fe4S-binding SPASM domain
MDAAGPGPNGSSGDASIHGSRMVSWRGKSRMANLIITGRCNRSCRFCFGRSSWRASRSEPTDMPLRHFRLALDFLNRSGIRQVRLLGGEPTLHPFFTRMVDEAMERDMPLLVFSNGNMPDPALRRLETIPVKSVKVIMNASAWNLGEFPSDPAVVSSLKRLGPRILLGLNLDTPVVQGETLVKAIQAFGLALSVRIGLAHPDRFGENAFLMPAHYTETGRRIAGFLDFASREGIGIEFDCGFVPCMFPDDAWTRFGDQLRGVGRKCNPILDVLPDLRVIPCFPLSGYRNWSLAEGSTADELRRKAEEVLKPMRAFRLFRECARCPMGADGACGGGCLSAAMRRRRFTPFEISVPA